MQNEKETLLQNHQKLSRELARLFSVDAELRDRINDIEKYKVEVCKAKEELQTKEFMVSTYVRICSAWILDIRISTCYCHA